MWSSRALGALTATLAVGCILPGIYEDPHAYQGGIRAAWEARSLVASAGKWDDLRAVAEIAGGEVRVASRTASVAETIADVMERCDESRPRDVAVVVDDTSSMKRFTDELRVAAGSFRAAAARGCRLALFSYRDRGDAYEARALAGFGEGASRFEEAYLGLRYEGGGDWAEGAWKALDAASAALHATGHRGLLVLISDAPAHYDPLAAERVHDRLADKRIDTVVVELFHPVHGKSKKPVPKRGAVVSLAALAGDLGAKHRAVERDVLATALAAELAAARASAPHGALDVALVVDASGGMSSTIRRLEDAVEPVRAFEHGGGRVAIVAYRNEGDAYAARVVVPLEIPSLAVHVLERASDRLLADEGAVADEAELALGVATKLAWVPGRARLVILISNQKARRNADGEAALRRFLAEPGSGATIIDVLPMRREKAGGGAPASAPVAPASAPAAPPLRPVP
ncbi:MAG TPA: vWA domain-containing protein [Myxococcota bacterium]|jgi:hypothetical protein|nr:vWA domain-containing protein [Myxococcota bacterium]